MILDRAETEIIVKSKSIISFVVENDWHRYITIEGKKACYIGNVCGTCEFLFARMEGANQRVHLEGTDQIISLAGIVKRLNDGIKKLDRELIDQLTRLLPRGEYFIVLFQINLKPTELWDQNDDFYAKTEYYPIDNTNKKDKKYKRDNVYIKRFKDTGLFEYLIPMFPTERLDRKRIKIYIDKLTDGDKPTAVALSILDIKHDGGVQHLAHYLIDGHHKVHAAAKENKPITLISFLAAEHGLSLREDISKLLQRY